MKKLLVLAAILLFSLPAFCDNPISPALGGTGVNNGTSTLTLGGIASTTQAGILPTLSQVLQPSNNLSDIASYVQSRGNLGLPTNTFIANMDQDYTLANPSPGIIYVNMPTSGHALELPPIGVTGSLDSSSTLLITVSTTSKVLTLRDSNSVNLVSLQPGQQYTAVPIGQLLQPPTGWYIKNITGGAGGSQDMQSTYDFGSTINLNDNQAIIINSGSGYGEPINLTPEYQGIVGTPTQSIVNGMSFTSNQNGRISSLCYGDAFFTSGSRQVGLWSYLSPTSGTLLATANVVKTDPFDTETGKFRCHLITPVLVSSGARYVVGSLNPVTDQYLGYITDNPSWAIVDGWSSPNYASSTLIYPPINDLAEGSPQWGNETLQFEPISGVGNISTINFNDSTSDPSTIFEIISTERASHPAPNMTDAQWNAISSPGIGDLVFDLDYGAFSYWDGTTRQILTTDATATLQSAYSNGVNAVIQGNLNTRPVQIKNSVGTALLNSNESGVNILGNALTSNSLTPGANINGVTFTGLTNISISAPPSGTAGGDLSGTYPNPIVDSTGGISFAPSATIDTTNAANITSGTLNTARLDSTSTPTFSGLNLSSVNRALGLNALTTAQFSAQIPRQGAIAFTTDAETPIFFDGMLNQLVATQSWANGQFASLSGSYANPTWITSLAGTKVTGNIGGNSGGVTGGYVSSLAGTANQVSVSASTGAVTLSLPQYINLSATPQFQALTLSGAASGFNLTNNTVSSGQTIAPINFNGLTSTSAPGIYARMRSDIVDNTNGAMTSDFIQSVQENGTLTDYLKLDGSVKLIEAFKPYTNSAQPRFFARYTVDTLNVTGGGVAYTIIPATTDSNVGSMYNSSTGIVTIPQTGFYHFQALVYLSGLSSSYTNVVCQMVTTARTYNSAQMGATARDANGNLGIPCSIDEQFTAGDTVSVVIRVDGSTQSIPVKGTSSQITYFSGYLLD